MQAVFLWRKRHGWPVRYRLWSYRGAWGYDWQHCFNSSRLHIIEEWANVKIPLPRNQGGDP